MTTPNDWKRLKMTINLTLERPLTNLDVRVVGIGGAGCSALRSLGDSLPDDTRFLGIDTGTGTDSVRNFAEFIQVGDGFGSSSGSGSGSRSRCSGGSRIVCRF